MAAKVQSVKMEIIPDDSADASYLYQDDIGFEERRQAYERGDFGFVGVRAAAEIIVNDITQTITSPGLWSIEDDSGEEYFESVYKEELATLYDMLRELSVDVSSEEDS